MDTLHVIGTIVLVFAIAAGIFGLGFIMGIEHQKYKDQ